MSLATDELDKTLHNFRWNTYQLRLSKGWTQKQFAEACGIRHNNISRHMHAQEPSLTSVATYASALGVSVSDLLGEPLELMEASYNNNGKEITLPAMSETAADFAKAWSA